MTRYDNLEEYNFLHAEIDRLETPQAEALGELLYSQIRPRSVIDIGCSSGLYLVPFRRHGCHVFGVDGSSAAGRLLQAHEFELADLRTHWKPVLPYDLCLCIETAEHLPEQHAKTLAATLTGCARDIFFSAARPSQGGEGHFNEQNQLYWLNIFGWLGYNLHPRHEEVAKIIRDSYHEGPSSPYAYCHWLYWNSMLLTLQT